VEALQRKATTSLGENSLVIGLSTATACLLAGIPIAYWLRYYARRWGNVVLFLITASMFASYLVRIYAWRSILGEHGLLNDGLMAMGVIHQPLQFLLYNRLAVVLALVHIFLPYVVLVLYAGMRPIRPEYFEAARDLGANAVKRWTRVVLPLIAPQLGTSWIFVFILSAGDYVTPQFLGGTDGSMIGVLVQQDFNVNGNWAGGAAISLLMLLAFAGAYLVMMGALRITGLSRVQLD
jgi:spermidine/putrescine transport system permease protein